ncbi:MAG: GAF domain-containing protein, partial [Proteobacteria bacterium]
MSYSTDLSFESERLHDLKRLRILDTAQDPLLDELTRMAAQVCEAPISLVSLVDQDRQWFKSRFGMDVTETPRSESFCSHAIAAHDLLLVEDATLDQRFAHLPAVLGTPAVRAYAGAPLVTKNGFAIGTICIVDHKPRQFTDTDKTLLTFLSKQVINYIENTNTLQDFQSKLAESHRLARLGEVGAKISHEMNTPLSIIVVRVAQVRRKIEQFMSDSKERTELIEDLNKVDAVVTRISKIIRGLNMYARSPESDAMEETDLTSIIEETLSFCRTRLWNDGVDLQLAPSASPIIVHCRPVQVSQILLNLMTNALDAVQK